MSRNSGHPNAETLALYAGGDLDLLARMRTAVHVRACGQCKNAVQSHQSIRSELPKLDLPPEVLHGISNWDRLSEEMTANIRLGLSAAECIGPSKAEPKAAAFHLLPKPWVPALAGFGLCVLSAGAFWLNTPQDQRRTLERAFYEITHGGVARGDRGVVLEATQSGLEMKQNGRPVITVRHPEQRRLETMSASLEGSVRAGYVDDETGQVTITNVYAGQ